MSLKNVTHSHASHKARGHCSISLFHVVTSLMGGGYTRYRDWPLALLGSLPFDRHLPKLDHLHNAYGSLKNALLAHSNTVY